MRHLLYENENEAALGLPPGVHSYAIIPIGYPLGEIRAGATRPLANIVYKDRWGRPGMADSVDLPAQLTSTLLNCHASP